MAAWSRIRRNGGRRSANPPGRSAHGGDKNEIAGVSFGVQMTGSLCVDKNGTPLRNSIIWADTRSGKEAQYIADHYGRDEFYYTTGHRLSSSHSITKLMWIRDHEPEVYKHLIRA